MGEQPNDGARLQNYEAFVAIVEAGNLTRAASRLGRSLQSISRSLASLEEQLGVSLVRRTTRQTQPTEAGMAFYQRVHGALTELVNAETEARDTASALGGALCIAASAFIAAHYLVPAIRAFTQQHPQVSFDLRISERFTEPVSSGADLIMRVGALPASPLKARKIGSIRRVTIAAPSYLAQRARPEIPADLAHHNCLIRSTSQEARIWTFSGAEGKTERVSVSGNFIGDNAYVVNHAVLAGLGVAVAPIFHMRAAIEAGQAEVILGDFTVPPVALHAIWTASRPPTRVRRFVDLLTQRLRRELI